MAKQTKKSDQNKPWNRRQSNSPGYVLGRRAKANLNFSIFCEGKNTEPYYFSAFRLKNASIEVLGLGMSKVKLVEEVHSKVSLMSKDKERQVWIVFDYDFNVQQEKNIQRDDFNKAIGLCRRYGYFPAYSNDSFELWFLLHYDILEAPTGRQEYYRRLSAFWKIDYEREGKSVSFCRIIYSKLLERQAEALKNAKKLFGRCNDQLPSEQNPCTTVFQLVEELNRFT